MHVTLNIENDQELRTHIKDAIRGQIVSIVREEITALVKEEVERKVKGSTDLNFTRLLREASVQAISNILYKEHQVHSWSSGFIKPVVEEKVIEAIKGKDWNKLVDDLAREKVKALIK